YYGFFMYFIHIVSSFGSKGNFSSNKTKKKSSALLFSKTLLRFQMDKPIPLLRFVFSLFARACGIGYQSFEKPPFTLIAPILPYSLGGRHVIDSIRIFKTLLPVFEADFFQPLPGLLRLFEF